MAEFEKVWASKEPTSRRGMQYSLIRVPKELPIDIKYTKPSLGINLTLMFTPGNETFWRIYGRVDADTIDNLGLPVSEPRQGETPPLLTSGDIIRIQGMGGNFERIEGSDLWRIDLNIPVNGVYHFLDRVWQPAETPRDAQGHPIDWQLTQVGVDYRDIPTKRSQEVSLSVYRRRT